MHDKFSLSQLHGHAFTSQELTEGRHPKCYSLIALTIVTTLLLTARKGASPPMQNTDDEDIKEIHRKMDELARVASQR
jgi:hypothetical protein